MVIWKRDFLGIAAEPASALKNFMLYAISHQFQIIQPAPAPKRHKRWLVAKETPEWQMIFNRRMAMEGGFGRMKNHRRLNNITVRQHRKVTVHSLIPVIVTQAVALAFPET